MADINNPFTWFKPEDRKKLDEDDLWDADPDCKHDVVDAPGGGVKCTKCKGWFCY